jgi:hypothetical protein
MPPWRRARSEVKELSFEALHSDPLPLALISPTADWISALPAILIGPLRKVGIGHFSPNLMLGRKTRISMVANERG